MTTIRIRPSRPDDIPALRALLNAIVRAGGTTAIEVPIEDDVFAEWFADGPGHVSLLVAESASGAPLGFQSLGARAGLPEGCADIATFARGHPKVPGVGRSLFAGTLRRAREHGVVSINATVRADNAAGLGYYRAMGFTHHETRRAVPLRDGTPIDRISLRRPAG